MNFQPISSENHSFRTHSFSEIIKESGQNLKNYTGERKQMASHPGKCTFGSWIGKHLIMQQSVDSHQLIECGKSRYCLQRKAICSELIRRFTMNTCTVSSLQFVFMIWVLLTRSSVAYVCWKCGCQYQMLSSTPSFWPGLMVVRCEKRMANVNVVELDIIHHEYREEIC